MAAPMHLHSINKAIPSQAWSSICARIAQVESMLEDSRVLTVNLPLLSSQKTDDKIQYGVVDSLFTVDRKWPKSWYGSAQLRTSADSAPAFDLFQRAALLIASHYARVHSVEFRIATEGSIEGWRLAGKLAAMATETPLFQSPAYLESLMDNGYLVPASENEAGAQWANVDVDQDLFDIENFTLTPPGNSTEGKSPVVWRDQTTWFF